MKNSSKKYNKNILQHSKLPDNIKQSKKDALFWFNKYLNLNPKQADDLDDFGRNNEGYYDVFPFGVNLCM